MQNQDREGIAPELTEEKRFFALNGTGKDSTPKGWNDPKNQTTLDEIPEGKVAGFAACGNGSTFAVIDYDHVLTDDGQIYRPALDVLKRIAAIGQTYTEISVSGHGLHQIINLGSYADTFDPISNGTVIRWDHPEAKIELFFNTAGRYIYLTGHHSPIAPNHRVASEETAAAIWSEYLRILRETGGQVDKKERGKHLIDVNGLIPEGERHYYVVAKIGELVGKLGTSVTAEAILALVEEDFRTRCANPGNVNMNTFRKKYLRTIVEFQKKLEKENTDQGFFSYAMKAWRLEHPGQTFDPKQSSWDEVRAAGERAKTAGLDLQPRVIKADPLPRVIEANPQPRATTVQDGKVVPVPEKKGLQLVTAAELEDMEIAPIRWLVKDMLPAGLAMLGAPPKYFKSYMALDLCVSVCSGTPFLGKETVPAACLYLDLESTQRRPQQRLRQILKDKPKPDNLYIVTGQDGVSQIGEGFEDQIGQVLDDHPEIKLVVVDVFRYIRPRAKGKQTDYDRDYEDLMHLKRLADARDISLLVLHHTTKMKHPDDPFNELTGSVGVTGSLDAAWVITKSKRADDEGQLHITGRDMESADLSIQFDKSMMRWKYLGTAEERELQQLVQEYDSSPIVATIRKLITQNAGHWEGSASDLQRASQYFSSQIHDDSKTIGVKIGRYEGLLWAKDQISYTKGRDRKKRTYVFDVIK